MGFPTHLQNELKSVMSLQKLCKEICCQDYMLFFGAKQAFCRLAYLMSNHWECSYSQLCGTYIFLFGAVLCVSFVKFTLYPLNPLISSY